MRKETKSAGLVWLEGYYSSLSLPIFEKTDSNSISGLPLQKDDQTPMIDIEIVTYLKTGEIPKSSIAQYHVSKQLAMGDS
ncbi:MAG: hypothetical protein QY322_03015 [bacterium]|nr:MAG: hypothetical protein QY322_03015 [bacterium]